MLGQTFYHQTLRKYVIVFGTLFNDINLEKRDGSDNVVSRQKVPIAYGPKQKFIRRIRQDPNLDRQVAISLPRMSFEISGIQYDGARKLTRIQKYKTVKTDKEGKVMNYNYTPVPYNISYTLNIFTATAESGLQIVEQILPFFQPDYTVTVIAVPELDIKRDVPIILNDVNYEDSYSSDYTTRRAVIYTLNFTAKTYLFGPATTQKTIKEVQSDLYSDTPTSTREERITITPNPTSADADDDFGFTTTITTFSDSKNYNAITDQDE